MSDNFSKLPMRQLTKAGFLPPASVISKLPMRQLTRDYQTAMALEAF